MSYCVNALEMLPSDPHPPPRDHVSSADVELVHRVGLGEACRRKAVVGPLKKKKKACG